MEMGTFLTSNVDGRRKCTVQYGAHQLGTRANTRLVEQLLQGCLDGRFRDAYLSADLLVRVAVQNALEHHLLALGKAAQPLILVLRVSIGDELDNPGIYPCLSTGDQPDGLQQTARRVALQENPGRAEP